MRQLPNAEVFIPPEETAHQIAWLTYAGGAISRVPMLGYSREAQGNGAELTIARTVQPGQNIREHPLFESVVVYEAAGHLPSAEPRQRRANHFQRVQNGMLATSFGYSYPQSAEQMPSKIPNTIGDGRTYVARLALADAWERLGVARRVHQRARLSWPIGSVGAAGFLRADIQEPFDRGVYERFEEIVGFVEQYRDLRPGLTEGLRTVYEALNGPPVDYDQEFEFMDRVATPHGHLWAELEADRQRFEARKADIAAGS